MNLGGTVRINPLGLLLMFAMFVLLVLYMTAGVKKEKDEDTKINLKTLLMAAVEVAEKGGREVRDTHSASADLGLKIKGETKEGIIDPVTNADLRSHCVMYHTITKNFPNIKVISEEHPEKQCENLKDLPLDMVGVVGSHFQDFMVGSDEVAVWIDPLDATKEFTENLLEYVTTMVCVSVSGHPIIGVIHRPFATTGAVTSWAWLGQGSSPDLARYLKENKEKKDSLDAPTIIVSRSHAGQVQNVSLKAFGPNAKVISAAGAGYKTMEVVSNNASIYIHTTIIKKWDICAGNAILMYMGGVMTTLRGDVIDYSPDSNPVNEDGLFAAMRNQDEYLNKLQDSSLF